MSDFNRNELKAKTLSEYSGLQTNASVKARPSNVNVPPSRKPQPIKSLDYDDDYEGDGFFSKLQILFPMIVVAIMCFMGYAWYTDKFAVSRNSGGELPVIKSNSTPLREKPEDPGGMKIVNRDKKVYDAISGKGDDKESKAANILPAPEEPLSHEEIIKTGPSPSEVLNKLVDVDSKPDDFQVEAAVKADVEAKASVISEAPQPLATPEKQAETLKPEVKDAKATPSVSQAPAIVKEESHASVPDAPKEAPVVAKPAPTATVAVDNNETPGASVKAVTAEDVTDVSHMKNAVQPKKATVQPKGHRVQVGSYRSAGDAESSWRSIKKKFPDILSNLNEYIEKADLGEKGVYYRLQLTGFKSEADARKVCQNLTSQKQGCFFVGK
jgi:hypothetical protein